MADFVKKTWECDDIITADELNRMEDGIEEAVECCGGGTSGIVVTNIVATDDYAEVVMPAAEVLQHMQNGELVVAIFVDSSDSSNMLRFYTPYGVLGDVYVNFIYSSNGQWSTSQWTIEDGYIRQYYD